MNDPSTPSPSSAVRSIVTLPTAREASAKSSVEELRSDLRDVTREVRPDRDLGAPGLREASDAGDLASFHGWNRSSGPQRPAAQAR